MAAEGYAILSLTLSGPSRCSGVVAGNESVGAVSGVIFAARNVCFKQLRVTHNSKTIDVPIVTSCPGCAETGIILSPPAWRQLEDISIRRMNVTWEILEAGTSTSTATVSRTTTTAEATTTAPATQQEQAEGSSGKPKASVLVPAILVPVLVVLAALILFFAIRRRRQRKKDWPTAFSIYNEPKATPEPSVTVRDDGKVVLSNEPEPSSTTPTPAPARDAKLGRVKEPASPPAPPRRLGEEPEEEVNALHRAMNSAGLNVQAVLATLRGNGATGDTRLPAYDP